MFKKLLFGPIAELHFSKKIEKASGTPYGSWFIISFNGNWLQTDGTPCYTENKIIQYVREKFSE